MMLKLPGAWLQPSPSVPLMITVITVHAASISDTYRWVRAERLDLRGMEDSCGSIKFIWHSIHQRDDYGLCLLISY